MYSTVLFLHSHLRWLVIGAGLVAIAHAWLGLILGLRWSSRARALGVLFASAVDLQVSLGLLLYFLSPLSRAAFGDMRAAMHNPHLRFFAVEHLTAMVIATVLVHVGSARARRAPTDAKRYRTFAVWTTLAAVLMFFAIPWPWLDVARPLLRR